MPSHITVLVAALAAAAFVREHRTRRAAERLSAATLESLLGAIDANDPETGQHVRRVALYALILAEAARLDEREQRNVERVALFHDVGKIDCALADILRDDHRLSAGERAAIAAHPALGALVLRPLAAFYPDLADGVLAHHEHWDGTGYPRGLRGESIPIAARIVTIADTFDAVSHGRPYSKARGAAGGATALLKGRGSQFDPSLVDLFLRPQVFGRARAALRQVRGDQKRDRRRGAEESPVPDITFRWRPEQLALRLRDPRPRIRT